MRKGTSGAWASPASEPVAVVSSPPVREIKDALVAEIVQDNVCVFVGAGVTISSCMTPAGSPPHLTWAGLLGSGARRCVALGLKDEQWEKRQLASIAARDPDELVTVGQNITAALKRHRSGELGVWLSDVLRDLVPTRPSLAEAIDRMASIVVSTNYDLTFEQITGRGKVSHSETGALLDVLRGRSRDVLHIHGHIDRPDDVVLGTSSYRDLLENETAQRSLQALALTKTLVFVGFGAGAGDPTFSPLFDFTTRVLGPTKERVYVVGRRGDRDAVLRSMPGVTYLPCGEDFEDLPSYLVDLAHAAKPRQGRPAASEPPGETLQLFSTRSQRTTLTVDAGELRCRVVDLASGKTTRSWSMPLGQARSYAETGRITAEPPPNGQRSGRLTIGPRENWMYSAKLFVSARDVVAQVNRLLGTSGPTTSPVPGAGDPVQDPRGGPQARPLSDFFLAAFSPSELRRFVDHHYSRLAVRLPVAGTAMDLAHGLVHLLQREGLVGEELREQLRSERPNRAAEIDALWAS